MFKKYMLSLAILGSVQQSHAHDDSWKDTLKATCVVAGITSAALISYKAYAHWLVKRVQSHFARERDLLNRYATYSAQYQSWTTHDAANLLRDLKASIIHLHNTNSNRWDISILYDIYYGQPAMYVNSSYQHLPLLQHTKDIDWYVSHFKMIRFLRLYPHEQELTALIEQLAYIKQMILSDYTYVQEVAAYNAS